MCGRHVADAMDVDGIRMSEFASGTHIHFRSRATSAALFLRQGYPVKPLLQALLLADHVYTDRVTGKNIVVGIFHRIFIRAQPPQGTEANTGELQVIRVGPQGHQAGSPFCYISLTEVRGEQTFRLRFVDLSDETALMEGQFTVTSPGPLATIEAIVALPMLPVNKVGTFALELLLGDEPLGAHRINVEEEKPPNVN
jgi:uncharacterized protein DUF6941